MSMYCISCGKELNDEETFCPTCGEKVGEPVISAFDFSKSNFQRNRENGLKSNAKTASKYFMATLISGILSVIFSALNYLGLPFVHMVGIVLGIIAICLANNDKRAGRFYSVPGFITGIIGLALGGFAFLYGFITSLISNLS